MNVDPKPLVACRECDLILREIELLPGGIACCRCCGAHLYRNSPDSLDRTLALVLTASMLLIIANVYPILGIEIQGVRNATNLYGAVCALWDQNMRSISLVVFITTILIPVIELSMMLYLLLPLRMRRVPAGVPLILRILQCIKPWGMVEVFMLGVLVSLVKLAGSASVIPGAALWSFGGLTLILAAVAASFNSRDIWAHLEIKSGGEELR
ncbi:MAG: paraquat-inducible protein A [Deltaproteobacteria bacterium]|nr:paraquat-inducible protein A [Deltaproteobacteria bacterium]